VGDVIDATPGEEFLKIAQRQAEAEIPADRHQDYHGREPEIPHWPTD
jgi:hypothetical protein